MVLLTGSGNDQNLIPKQAILGGGTLKSSQYSNKSSLESLVSGETSSLTSARCVSSREDISFESELFPRRESTALAEEKGAVSDGNSIVKSYCSSSFQPGDWELTKEVAPNEDCSVGNKDIANIVNAFDSSLKLNDKINGEEQSRMFSESREGVVFGVKEDHNEAVKRECRLADDGGGGREVGIQMNQPIDLQLIDVENGRKANMLTNKHPSASEGKEEMMQEAGHLGIQQTTQKNVELGDKEDTHTMEKKETPSVETKDGLQVPIGDSLECPTSDTSKLPVEDNNEIPMEVLGTDGKETPEESTEELLEKSGEVEENNDLAPLNYEQADSSDTEEDSTDIESEQVSCS